MQQQISYNFEMAVGVGLVSALLLAKKSAAYKTRLQKLQIKLRKRPLQGLTLYQLPIQKLLSIAFITLFLFFIALFETMYLEQTALFISVASVFQQKVSLDEQEKLRAVLWWIKVAYYGMIFALFYDLKWKVLTVAANRITLTEYCNSKWGQKVSVDWDHENMSIQIVKNGESRFTQNSEHYSLQIYNKSSKQMLQILKRSHIFSARKSMIELGSVLSFKPNLRIH